MYTPFGEFRRANSYCHLYGDQGQRQAYFYPLATMNFVGLVLITADRCLLRAVIMNSFTNAELDIHVYGLVNGYGCAVHGCIEKDIQR
ncbi:hypothetical protein TNCV_2540401 [Trichonephila clavipes]|nr:hypothetical protein TNCV_2540401 [Trichonephila clavipes]